MEILLGTTVLLDGDGDPNNGAGDGDGHRGRRVLRPADCRSRGPGLLAQYLLDIELTDATAPVITSTNLPQEGTTSQAVLDRFTLGFSENLEPGTVTNAANLDLRSAGPDGALRHGG